MREKLWLLWLLVPWLLGVLLLQMLLLKVLVLCMQMLRVLLTCAVTVYACVAGAVYTDAACVVGVGRFCRCWCRICRCWGCCSSGCCCCKCLPWLRVLLLRGMLLYE